MSKIMKTWTVLFGVLTGGIAIAMYTLAPVAEAGFSFN